MDRSIVESENGVDLAKRRVVKTKDNKEIYVELEDPYGFWKVRYKNGAVPAALQGAYTRAEFAIRAINHYLDEKESQPHKIKYKPGYDKKTKSTASTSAS